MLFRTRMFLNLFARETRGENTAIFVTSLGRMKNLSFCRNSILWYQRMLVVGWLLWALSDSGTPGKRNYAIYLSRSSPTLLSPDSLGNIHYGDVTESKGSRLARNTARDPFVTYWPRRENCARYLQLYSCFEKRARDNPERYCGWFWSSLFYKEIWKNGTRGHGHVFESAKGKQQK